MNLADPYERTASRKSQETRLGRDEAPSLLPWKDGDRAEMCDT